MFRYPGGKSKLKKEILHYIQSGMTKRDITEYREPFFGGGSIGIEVLKLNIAKKFWINDFDKGISDIWSSVISEPDRLCGLISEYVPKVDDFFTFKDKLLKAQDDRDRVLNGFMKLAIHQISYSGLGVKSGGPLGGLKQESQYNINCRWSPKKLVKDIREVNRLFSNVEVHDNQCDNSDFEASFSGENSMIYLDPPYYVKGGELYQHSFSIVDHIRLMNSLQKMGNRHAWVLSYDDCDEIIDMYSWAEIVRVNCNYTINTSRNKDELIILPKRDD